MYVSLSPSLFIFLSPPVVCLPLSQFCLLSLSFRPGEKSLPAGTCILFYFSFNPYLSFSLQLSVSSQLLCLKKNNIRKTRDKLLFFLL